MGRRDKAEQIYAPFKFIPAQGVWFIYGWDQQAYPVNVFQNELDARRWSDENAPYDKVIFWPYGMKFEDAIKKEVQDIALDPPTIGARCNCGKVIIGLGRQTKVVGGTCHFLNDTCGHTVDAMAP